MNFELITSMMCANYGNKEQSSDIRISVANKSSIAEAILRLVVLGLYYR
ncbi:MAG: hypothetical protein K2I53_13985 [Lachnospiraceae bacterium]|nr:hypothetical protein [Lachnospiraceae bacterium]